MAPMKERMTAPYASWTASTCESKAKAVSASSVLFSGAARGLSADATTGAYHAHMARPACRLR
jgi:hypothetical protein